MVNGLVNGLLGGLKSKPSWKMEFGTNGFRIIYPIYEMENNPVMFETTNQLWYSNVEKIQPH